MADDIANSLGSYITTEYEVLRRIFSFLSLADLLNCNEICDEWKVAALATITSRRVIQIDLLDLSKKQNLRSDASLTLLFHNSSWDKAETDKIILTEKLVHIYANLGLIFVHDAARYAFPLHQLKPPKKYTAMVRFPPHPQVMISTFDVGEHLLTESEMEKLINVPSNVPIQAIMIIGYTGEIGVNVLANVKMLRHCAEKRKPSFAIAGCWISQNPNCKKAAMTVVLFAGSNVEAGSCVLDNFCRTSNAIDSKVEQFSKLVPQLKNSVVFIFRCHSRRKVRRCYKYGPSENVETWEIKSIRNYFSNSYLAGCYGSGEMGIDYPSISEPKEKRGTIDESLEYAFSSILLYIGFKN